MYAILALIFICFAHSMYVCMYVYACVNVCDTRSHIHLLRTRYVCMCIFMCIYVRHPSYSFALHKVCMYVCMYVCVCVNICDTRSHIHLLCIRYVCMCVYVRHPSYSYVWIEAASRILMRNPSKYTHTQTYN